MAIASNSLAIQAQSLLTEANTAVSTASNRAANQQVRSAVNTLNQSQSAGSGREFSISIDSKTKQPVVKIIDSTTHELIEQIPSQSILDLAKELGVQSGSSNLDSGR